MWDLRQWRHCIFRDESWFSLYHSDGRVWVRRRQGERLTDACVKPHDGNRGPPGFFWPLEAGTHANIVGVREQYHVPPICSELFQCAVLIFTFGAKCELRGCALVAWLHTLPANCHQFNDTICICAAFSHINLLPTNVKIVPWTWFIWGVSDYFKIVPKYEPMQPTCGWFHNVGC